MRACLTFLLSIALSIPAILASNPHHDARDVSRAHHGLARRALASNDTGMSLTKRAFTNARATHFKTGQGACGKYNVPSDFIVALNHVQYGSGYPGPHCFQKIRITYKGISAVAQIMDMCPGCDYGMLDLTDGLFSHFVPLHTDIFYMSWEFIDGDDDEPAPPKTTTKPQPTSTKTTTKPSSTKTTSTTKSHASTTKTSNSSSPTSTATSSTSLPAPTADLLPPGTQNIPALQQAILGMAGLMNASNAGAGN